MSAKLPIFYTATGSDDTITVAELITELQKHDPTLPVGKTWEGQILPMRLDDVRLSLVHRPAASDSGTPYLEIQCE